MTSRLPRMSTTIVKIRKQPKVVVTHGGRLRTASLGSCEELFRWDSFWTIVQLQPTQLSPTEANSTCGWALKSGLRRCRWLGTIVASRGFHVHPLLGLLRTPARALPGFSFSLSAHSPSLSRSLSLWPPQCHFCARVPFTLSVRMCDMKPPLRTCPACDQTRRRGAVFIHREKCCRLVAADWKSNLQKRPTSFHYLGACSFMALWFSLETHSLLFLKNHSCLELFSPQGQSPHSLLTEGQL